MLKNYLLVFFVSMVPVVELRGAIPIGLGLGLPVLPTYVICVLGNMLPVPFIYLFARRFLIWGYHKPVIGPICRFFIVKGEKGGRKLEEKAGKGLTVALLLFVGIPLPGTGAWTGTLAASILDMKFKDVLIACMGGVLLAGIIMGLASMGVLGAASAMPAPPKGEPLAGRANPAVRMGPIWRKAAGPVRMGSGCGTMLE